MKLILMWIVCPELNMLDATLMTITAAHTAAHRPFLQRVLFWGCFSDDGGQGPLVFINGTMNSERYKQTLGEHLRPYQAEHFPNRDDIFQQDNAPCHQSRSSVAFLQQNGITTLPWPPYSPDLNLIENLWGYMKKIIHRRGFTTKSDLIAAVNDLWHSEELREQCSRLCDSMSDRIKACILNKGGYTSY